jgi:hypothetical protein
VAWIGPSPVATVPLEKFHIPAGPSILPARAYVPALNRVLAQLALDPNEEPCSWQILGDRLRLTLPQDAARIDGGEDALRALAPPELSATSTPLRLGFFGERALGKRLAGAPAGRGTVDGVGGLVASSAEIVRHTFDLGDASVLASPHALPCGALALGATLHDVSLKRGVRQFASGLEQPFRAWQAGWSRVSCSLASGEDVVARAMVFALNDDELERAIPEPSKRLRGVPGSPLLRLSMLVSSRGLPAPLGRFAVAHGPRPFWMERQPLQRGLEVCSLFWRCDGTDRAEQMAQVLKTFGQFAPFVERHIEGMEGPTNVPGHDAPPGRTAPVAPWPSADRRSWAAARAGWHRRRCAGGRGVGRQAHATGPTGRVRPDRSQRPSRRSAT